MVWLMNSFLLMQVREKTWVVTYTDAIKMQNLRVYWVG